MPAIIPDFSTPHSAIHTLEAAYAAKSIDGAVRAKDFRVEARFLLANKNSRFAEDLELIAKTSEVLELAYRAELKKTGFPDMTNMTCTLEEADFKSTGHAVVTETCVWTDGAKTIETVNVYKGIDGWRVVNVPREP